jgi:hypothetical protein
MKSVKTERFRKAYDNLPKQVKVLTHKAYQKWKENPVIRVYNISRFITFKLFIL